MRPLVIGTSGHIDHGKTALVKALTGVDTDRLVEEQRRGITIELGFTHLTLPSGRAAGFVDVPGHERFVRTMIAGATGLDLVLLVIAADEGVMPQTREHLDILDLLGVDRGVVVLTKVDLVDAELLELASLDVADLLEGGSLAGAPIVPFSAVTGQGREALMAAIDEVAQAAPLKAEGGPARLPIDRVFSQRGFGTVITGTLSSGGIGVGDALELLPQRLKVKVRGLQVHGQEVDRAGAGSRAAVNLQGVERQAVSRGDVLAAPGSLPLTSVLDVRLRVLGSAAGPLGGRRDELTGEITPLSQAVQARILTGTLEVMARIQPLGAPWVAPGEAGYAQLRLERPIPAQAGDRFVVRSESPMVTIAGGVVIDPGARRHRRRDEAVAVAALARLWEGEPAARVEAALALAGPQGITAAEAARLARLSGGEAGALVDAAAEAGQALPLDGERWAALEVVEALQARILERLDRHHQARPLSVGAPRGELRPGPWVPERLLSLAVGRLVAAGEVVVEGPALRRADFQIAPTLDEAALASALVSALAAAGLTPPTLPQLLAELPAARGDEVRSVEDLVAWLVQGGQLVRVKEDLLFDPAAVEGLIRQVTEHLEAHGHMSPTDFKALTGLTRRHAIPLLEHLDKIQLTLRVGDSRQLRT